MTFLIYDSRDWALGIIRISAPVLEKVLCDLGTWKLLSVIHLNISTSTIWYLSHDAVDTVGISLLDGWAANPVVVHDMGEVTSRSMSKLVPFPVVEEILDWLVLVPGGRITIFTTTNTGDDICVSIAGRLRPPVVRMNLHTALGLGILLQLLVDLHVTVPILDLVVGSLQDIPVLVSWGNRSLVWKH